MLQSPLEKIQDHIRCGICLDNVTTPYLCPRCSKMFCKGCIEKCLEVNKKCPHCRFTVRNQKQFIRCYWVDQLSNDLENFDKSLCHNHKEKLSLYCNDCCVSLCSHCALFESDHENHEIFSIKDTCAHYHSKIEDLKQTIRLYERRLQSSYLAFQNNLNECEHERENMLQHVCSTFDHCSKLVLSFQRADALKEMEKIECLLESFHYTINELDNELELSNPISFIKKAEGVIENIENVINRSTHNPLLSDDKLKLQDTQVYLECMNFVPRYEVKIMKLYDFSHLSANDKIVHVEPIVFNSLVFKLEVHSGGLATDLTQHKSILSMFLLVKSSTTFQSYLHFSAKVEIVNQHGSQHLDKSCCFLVKIPPDTPDMLIPVPINLKLTTLHDFGYIIPEIDCLVLRFAIRPISFETQTMIQGDYIKQLENKLNVIKNTVKNTVKHEGLATSHPDTQSSKLSKLVQSFSSMWS